MPSDAARAAIGSMIEIENTASVAKMIVPSPRVSVRFMAASPSLQVTIHESRRLAPLRSIHRAHGARSRRRLRVFHRLRHGLQIFDDRIDFRGLEPELEPRHLCGAAADHFLNGVLVAIDQVLVQRRPIHLESRARRSMANAAALLEDALAQFLSAGKGGVRGRFLRSALLSAGSRGESRQDEYQSPSGAVHGGFSSANSITKGILGNSKFNRRVKTAGSN